MASTEFLIYETPGWTIVRGDPPEAESPHDAAACILAADGVEVIEHEGELDGFIFAVHDGDLAFMVVTTSRGRQAVCECGTALLQDGGCAHLLAVASWFAERADAEADKTPRPFFLRGG